MAKGNVAQKPSQNGTDEFTASTLDDRIFRQLVDSIRDYEIILLDTGGQVMSWNEGARCLKGYSEEEILGRHFSCFYTQDDIAQGKPEMELKMALASGRIEDLGWRVRKDGSRFWANMILQPIRDQEGNLVGYAKMARDMTERKAADDALVESDERFRALIAAIENYAIILLDIYGKVVTWNDGAEQLKGFKAEEIIGQSLSRFYLDEDVQAGLPTEHLKMAASRGRVEVSGLRKKSNGSTFLAKVILTSMRDEAGKLKGFTKFTQDITEKDRIENTIGQTVSKLAALSSQMAAVASEQLAGIQIQASSISETASATDEISQTIAQTADRSKEVAEITGVTVKISKDGCDAVKNAIGSMEKVQEEVESIASNILALAEQAKDIGEIITTVNEIAEQTNLLALNAAIEAARAGEHGRGFSVVASEIKALADQSKKSTHQVRQILSDIQKATNRAVMSTEEGTRSAKSAVKIVSQAGETITSLGEAIEKASQVAIQIAAATGQQVIGMNQIQQAIGSIDEVTRSYLESNRQTEQSTQELSTLATDLRSLVKSEHD
ncbi:MAG: PAS domain-containing methyl-accepting chemotaxis protein [Candidatus Melainabacteria bacterium]|nr:PAS domain-containing methyl-accepting chemotaxis protein [Candidatus Melainabacteria bacterium]